MHDFIRSRHASKAVGRFSEFIEKLESVPYGLGFFIAIFMFFVFLYRELMKAKIK
jgi:hypothetical protein